MSVIPFVSKENLPIFIGNPVVNNGMTQFWLLQKYFVSRFQVGTLFELLNFMESCSIVHIWFIWKQKNCKHRKKNM